MSQWLQDYLEDALRENLCTTINCTTCGGIPFRKGLLVALGRHLQVGSLDHLAGEAVAALRSSLSTLEPPPVRCPLMEGAVRFLLFEVWTGLPTIDGDLEKVLNGSWCGGVLDTMKCHHEARMVARQSHEGHNDPSQIEIRRALVRKAKEERHKLRLIAKRERDQAWKLSQQAKDTT